MFLGNFLFIFTELFLCVPSVIQNTPFMHHAEGKKWQQEVDEKEPPRRKCVDSTCRSDCMTNKRQRLGAGDLLGGQAVCVARL